MGTSVGMSTLGSLLKQRKHAALEEVPECQVGSDYMKLIKDQRMSKKGEYTLRGNKSSFTMRVQQQSSQNAPTHFQHGEKYRIPMVVVSVKKTTM